MKNLLLVFIGCMILVFSSLCGAENKKDLNKDQISSSSKSLSQSKKQKKQKVSLNKKSDKKNLSKVGDKKSKKLINKKTKKEKYVFKKKEQNVYKFDEKGNPIFNSIKKSTSSENKSSNELLLGVEEKVLKSK